VSDAPSLATAGPAVQAVLDGLPPALRARVPDAFGLGDRALFPDLSPPVYLNHASVSPPSLLVRAVLQALIDDYAVRGVGAVADAAAGRERLRTRLASLVGAGPADIGLLPNTTHGVIAVANSLPWRAGDGVLCFTGEFPTNVVPWQRAAATFDLRLELAPLDDFGGDVERALDRVEARLRQGLRLVAVSAVQFRDGTAMPLAALAERCHHHGAELFVDAIQAVGIVPLDLVGQGIDYLACGSHKWLMGTEGCGFLAVHPARVAALVPRLAGWLSVEEPLDFLFSGRPSMRYDKAVRARADMVEVGAPNVLGFAALEAGAAPVADLGPATVLAHVQRIHDALEGPLQDRGFRSLRATEPAARSGILSLWPPAGVALPRLVADLGARGISVAEPDGRLRLSPHWCNDLGQVPAVLEAFDGALGAQRG